MTSAHAESKRYRIDDLLIDAGSRKVTRDGESLELSKLSFDLLLALIEAAPNVLTADAIVQAVWGGTIVSDETVTQRIKVLRDALDRDGNKQRYIETIRAVGYRLCADVIHDAPAVAAQGAPKAPAPRPGAKWAAAAVVAILIGFGAMSFRAEQPQVTVPAEKSIAVLPFAAMSSGADDGYFADGLTEEILNALTQIPQLLVTARTSAFLFKGVDAPVPAIANTLGVAHLVEGTVRRDGDRLRVTAQLVRASDGFHVWSDSFDRSATDDISVQIEIAEKIAAALDVLLDDDRKARMRAAGVRDPEAFIAYQKGVESLNAAHGSSEMLRLLAEANRHFEAALARVPEFSDAYLQHTDYFSHAIFRITAGHAPEGFSSEDVGALRTALVDDYNAAVRYAPDDNRRINAGLDRSLITGDWMDLDARITDMLAAPGCRLPIWFDVVALPYGDIERSLETFQREVECDPLDFVARLHEFRLAMWQGHFAAALDAATLGAETTGNAALRMARVTALIALGRFEEAQTAIDRDLTDTSAHHSKFILAAAQGDAAQARAVAEHYPGKLGKTDHDAVHTHALVGDRKKANLAAAAIDARPFGHMVLANAVMSCLCGAPFDLEATPSFAQRIAEAGLAWPPTTPIDWPLKTW